MNTNVLAALPPDDATVQIVPMLTTSRAVDLFLGDLTRRSRSESGRTVDSYRRLLYKFCDQINDDADVTEIRPDDCRRFLDLYTSHSRGYQATIHATLNSFLEWLYQQQRIKRNPLDHIARARRPRPEDLDVTTIATVDVPLLLSAARTWTETLSIAIPAYLGPRRRAAALLRLRDYRADRGLIRFREKGAKTIWKPVPEELAALLNAAIDDGAVVEPDDYLIPPEGYLTRRGDRDDRVIWRVVKRVAARAGVEAHVHALRAAFATFYLEQNPNDIVGLQELMGHRSIETTRVYLRKLDKQRAMERVRTLSWSDVAAGNRAAAVRQQFAGIGFESSLAVGAGGFEPPHAESSLPDGAGSQHGAPDLVDTLTDAARAAADAKAARP